MVPDDGRADWSNARITHGKTKHKSLEVKKPRRYENVTC
jgi:hypothetical protein